MEINQNLKELNELTNENVRPFVEGACWADLIKTWSKAYDDWHFKDVPIFQDGFQKDVTINPYNSEWALRELESTLKETCSGNNTKLMKSEALRFYIHIVGDLHQPLHSAAVYSYKFPEGDLGGNLFTVQYKDYTQLHRLWDAGCDLYRDDTGPFLPLDYEGLMYYEAEAKALASSFSRQYFEEELKKQKYGEWVEETYKKAIKYAYAKLKVGEELNNDYIREGQIVSQK